jgi:hypothetical protein
MASMRHNLAVVSRLAWLDASADEQRRVREIVQLFSQRETQDELGGRRVVVALSDALFPGSSVLLSRARYVLFVPWFAKVASSKKDPSGWFEWLERSMIKAFLDDETVASRDRLDGLIGRMAGPQVKQLPSSAYWTALGAWGILLVPGTVAVTLRRTRHAALHRTDDDADELAGRVPAVWHHGVGDAPPGFPMQTIAGGFALTGEEAEWLRERWLATTQGSLLAHLAEQDSPLGDDWPWTDPACRSAAPDVVAVLDDAQRFSLAIHGAQLLYHLMLSERYLERGYDAVEVDLDVARWRIEEWIKETRGGHELFDGWDPHAFWAFVRSRNARVDAITRRFFDIWFDRARGSDVDGVADDDALREAVAAREQFLKRSQARLVNGKLLAGWQGGAPGRVEFRWRQVRQLVSDMHEGLARDAGP